MSSSTSNHSPQPDTFLRWPVIRRTTGLSRSTVWRLERRGMFPKRRQLSPGTVGWLSSEVERWMEQRPSAAV